MSTNNQPIKISRINTNPEIDPYHMDTNTLAKTALVLDYEDRAISWENQYDSNGTPEYIWNGRGTILKFHGYIRPGDAKTYLEHPETQSLLQRIYNGYTAEYIDGNLRGILTEDAQSALAELENDAQSYCDWEVTIYTTDEYLADWASTNITSATTDNEIDAYTAELAPDPDTIVIGNIKNYLTNYRNDMIKNDLGID